MPLPHSYSELYPGRFLKADILKGQKVTLTIKDITVEDLIGENNKTDPKVIVLFVQKNLELVFPKTNAECIKRMFGADPHLAIGKRITLFPSTTKFGLETVECIRVWGSPDIAADMPITIPQGRKKPLEMIMHKVRPGECGYRGTPEEIAAASAPAQPIAQVMDDAEDEGEGEEVPVYNFFNDAPDLGDEIAP